MKMAALVLAGGGGTRLGGIDKGLLNWQGEAFVVRLARLLEPVGPVAIVTQAGHDAYKAPLRQQGLTVEFVHDPWVEQGPMAGLVAGLEWARSNGREGIVVVPCDSPWLDREWLERLLKSAAEAPGQIHVCEVEGRLQPLHGWFPVEVEAPLREAVLAGNRRVGQWVSAQNPRVIPCSDLAEQFLNVNTPADRARLS